MFERVEITKWDADEDMTHIRTAHGSGVRSAGSVVIDASVEATIEAGLAVGVLRESSGGGYTLGDLMNCLDAEEAIEGVLAYDADLIAESRRQMVDAGLDDDDELSVMSDVEIAAMDWRARAALVEMARTVDNAWASNPVKVDSDEILKRAVAYVGGER